MGHIDYLKRLVPDLGQRKILDVGSGRGAFYRHAKEHGITDVTGLEPYDAYVEMTKGLFPVYQGTGEHMPFADGSFGFLNISEVTEHCDNPDQLLKEAHRVLQPGGAAYVGFTNRYAVRDPHFHLWFVNWLPRSLCERYIGLWGKHKDYSHTAGRQRLSEMHYFTYGGAKRALARAGFKRVVDSRLARIPALLRPLYYLVMPLWVNSHHFVVFK